MLPDLDFTKIAKSWLFYWGFWHFWLIFGKTNLVILNPQLPVSGSWGFSATRYGFHKKAKSWLFYWAFWHFCEIFGKTASGNTVQTGHQNNWDGLMSVPNPDSSTYQNQTANQLNPPKIPNFEPTNRVGPNTTLALMKIKLKSTWFTMSKPLIHRGLYTLILPGIIEYLGNYQWHWNILVSLLFSLLK